MFLQLKALPTIHHYYCDFDLPTIHHYYCDFDLERDYWQKFMYYIYLSITCISNIELDVLVHDRIIRTEDVCSN